jgi:Protein of unknown function (DUF2730)
VNIAEIKDWLIVVQLAGTGLLFVLLLYAKSVFVTRGEYKKFADDVGARLTAQSERVGNVDTRVLLVERTQQGMPTKDSLHRLELSLQEMKGIVGVTNERLSGVEDLHQTLKHQVNVMDEFIRTSK